MKKFLTSLLVFAVIGIIIYFFWIKIANNKDEYDKLYEKYLSDSNFECKILKCTSNSNIEINGINFSLTRDLNVNERAYYFKLKSNDMSFNGAYNLIDGEEISQGVKLPIQITFIFNIGDIRYSGIYYVSNQNLDLTPMYNNYDYSNYLSHKAIAKEISEYIVNSVKTDLES